MHAQGFALLRQEIEDRLEMAAWFAYGPTRTFPWTSAYVGCLRASGLVMLAARFSESDPEQT
jgi:hypothetical protein